MRAPLAIAGSVLAVVLAAGAHAQSTADTTKVYALVASFPDKFSFIHETRMSDRNGSVRVDHDRRSTHEAPDGTFNRMALAGLEKALAKRDPQASHVLLSVRATIPKGLGPTDREEHLVARVTAELEKMPERKGWHRILVAVPAYRALSLSGLPGRLEGFGVFLQPNCASNPKSCGLSFTPDAGPEVVTPSGEATRANFYVAPYSYVSVWTLDAATLAVIDHQSTYDHQKMYDPHSGTLDMGKNIPREILAREVVNRIERSIVTALTQGEPAGTVNVGDVREVKPGAAK